MFLHIFKELYLNLVRLPVHLFQSILRQNLELKHKGKGVTIIVISGLGGGDTRKEFYELFKKLNRSGVVIDFGVQTGRVDDYSKRLHVFIKNKNVVLIGISMGGIIAARYIQKHGWNNIDKLITVSSPFKGVNVPRIFSFLRSVQDLRSGSALMDKLKTFKAPKNKMVCVYGKWDQYMRPGTATVTGADNIQLHTFGHFTTEIKSVNTIYNLLK